MLWGKLGLLKRYKNGKYFPKIPKHLPSKRVNVYTLLKKGVKFPTLLLSDPGGQSLHAWIGVEGSKEVIFCSGSSRYWVGNLPLCSGEAGWCYLFRRSAQRTFSAMPGMVKIESFSSVLRAGSNPRPFLRGLPPSCIKWYEKGGGCAVNPLLRHL